LPFYRFFTTAVTQTVEDHARGAGPSLLVAAGQFAELHEQPVKGSTLPHPDQTTLGFAGHEVGQRSKGQENNENDQEIGHNAK
jgi:hypothetical protein